MMYNPCTYCLEKDKCKNHRYIICQAYMKYLEWRKENEVKKNEGGELHGMSFQ